MSRKRKKRNQKANRRKILRLKKLSETLDLDSVILFLKAYLNDEVAIANKNESDI